MLCKQLLNREQLELNPTLKQKEAIYCKNYLQNENEHRYVICLHFIYSFNVHIVSLGCNTSVPLEIAPVHVIRNSSEVHVQADVLDMRTCYDTEDGSPHVII